MKYRHACHAGNFADVMKHVVLTAAMLRLTGKERALFVLDTHAGRGRYDITGSSEAASGISRLAASASAFRSGPVARYLAIVREVNREPGPAVTYPGSPVIVSMLMRPQDRAALCELAPAEAGALRREFRGDARVGVHCRDGFEALSALLPPQEKRGLVLVDPPYEQQESDLVRVADALAATASRWPQGVLLGWYPIKQGAVAARLHRRLVDAGVRRLLVAELCIHPDDSRAGLNGSGVVAINPPWRLEEDLRQELPLLHGVLAVRGAGRITVARLADE